MTGSPLQYQRLPLAYVEDSAQYFTLIRPLGRAVWLDSGFPTSQYGRYDILSAAPAVHFITQGSTTFIHTEEGFTASSEDPFLLVTDYLGELKQNLNSADTELPFVGGALGYFGYDLGRRLETLTSMAEIDVELPDMFIGIFPWAIIQDHHLKKSYLVINNTLAPSYNFLKITDICQNHEFLGVFHEPRNNINVNRKSFNISKFKEDINVKNYHSAVNKIQDYIHAGDCYQINFAQRFTASYQGDPLLAFLHLRSRLPSPFSGYIEFDDQAVVSISPERFILVDASRAMTQPIKGTIARGKTAEEDKANADWLENSLKNRAENLMIVDLLRNDFSKQCDEVQVPKFCELQSFTNVHHLVSSVIGKLRPNSHPLLLLRDAFPGGSITGAPKIRAMEIIEELEPTRRNIYCGSLGYMSCHGRMDTNIAIRTLVCANGKIHVWGGGGITADSDASEEYQETLAKVSLLMSSLEEQFSH